MSQAPPPYPGEDTKVILPPQGYGTQPGPPPGPYDQYPPPAGPYGPPMQAAQPGYGIQPGLPPGPAGVYGPAATVVVTQPNVTVVQTFRDTPVHIRCHFCHADIVTATDFEVGGFTWLICVIMCLFVGIFGLIPFCVDSCKDVTHTCPSCHQQVGRFSRL